jgi:hypothetical protein
MPSGIKSRAMGLECAMRIGRIGAMLSFPGGRDKPMWCLMFLVAIAALGVNGCGEFRPFAPLHPGEALRGSKETFTGKIVLVPEGYRLRLTDSGDLVRLTRASHTGAFSIREVNLQKYYEKTLAVRAARKGEWLWGAQIVGQWLRPGESRGSNLLAPPVRQP